jgi:flagellar hook-associated protein 2
MGTVGLSFGSPTSGTGFDVSSTVAEIIGNLQNVETPWKTQLTSLEGQDTAISSLGTLFSNLSTDIGNLTDFQGILAEKMGSSSDTNVLELTSASTSAVAGTHTVVVNALAQTSSGYMAPVASASDKLSGAVTLQLGSRTKTITLNSSDNTLAGLASAINSSGIGINASVLTDASGSRLSLVSGTSGATSNITVSANSLAAAVTNTLSYSGTAGSGSVASTGTLSPVSSTSATLSGSLSIQVGSGGTAQTVNLSDVTKAEGGATLADLAKYITDNTATLGATASVVTNSDGSSSLSLLSNTAGSAGTLTVISKVSDTATALNYTSTVNGANANLEVDGVTLTSASNTVANLIPGVTFQLLAPSATETGGGLEQVQVVIGNDNSAVESTMNQMVSDYNSLISAVNTQEGNTSSGTPEPLFGSPTLSLLQQQLLSGLNTQSPNGYLDSISSTADSTLSGAISISMADGIPLFYSGTAGTDATASTGTLAPIENAGDTLSGSISIQVGSGTTQTINVGDSSNPDTLDGLKAAITAANIGVTASIVTNSDGSSSLSLLSGTSGTAGTLTVSSSIADTSTQTIQVPTTSGNNTLAGLASAINTSHSGVTAAIKTTNGESYLTFTSNSGAIGGTLTVDSSIVSSVPAPVTYADAGYTSTTGDYGTLGTLGNADDTLSGTLTIQVGSGTAQTITLDSSNNTLSGLMGAINNLTGVSATLNKAGTGLILTSGTDDAAGALTVTSNLVDTTSPTTTALNYTQSSDINNLTSLGISVNNNGSLTFDATSLDSALNTNYSAVVGFFQNANSWGQSFSNMLSNAGSGSPTGILALASKSNSSIESTLNAEISKEQSYISSQQTSLTAELNSANEIMQQLPSQLQGVNELYSAITGYNQNQGG